MKDYTIKREDRHEFILSYEIEEKNIIIKYASGKIHKTPYTRELEKYILEKMKYQIANSSDFLRKQIDKLILTLSTGSLSVVMAIICLVMGAPEVAGICGILCGVNVIGYSISSRKVDDYIKNTSFIMNMELFKNGINRDMPIYANLKKSTQMDLNKLVEAKANDKEYDNKESILIEPTVNTIDKVSYSSYEEIYELLKQNEEFSKYYDDFNSKKKILTK